MTKQETELVWLTQKVQASEDLIRRAQDFFDDHRFKWSRGVEDAFYKLLEQKLDQLFFEQSRLEKLAWQIHEERERLAGREGVVPRSLM